jgi:hypothetical protein
MIRKVNLSMVLIAITAALLITSSALAQDRNESSAVTNKDNPYDYVGVKHNQILRAFFNSDDYRSFRESKAKNPSEVVTAFFSKCCATQISCCTGNPPPDPRLSTEKMIRIADTGRRPLEMLGKMGVSRTVTQYAEQVESALRRLPKNTAHTRSSYKAFFVLEQTILRNRKLAPVDRRQALMMVAGARYSAHFWNGVKNGRTPPRLTDGGDGTVARIDWDEVAGVDAMGCIGGPEAGAAASILDYLSQLMR